MNPMDIKRGIDLAVTTVVADLEAHARKVSANSEIAQVATISANGDEEVGRILAEAMEKVGNEGVITVEEAQRSEEHTSELQSLMRISYAVFCLKKKKTPFKLQPNSITPYSTDLLYTTLSRLLGRPHTH